MRRGIIIGTALALAGAGAGALAASFALPLKGPPKRRVANANSGSGCVGAGSETIQRATTTMRVLGLRVAWPSRTQ